jgi:tetratricopeptide (TPR) repeat protein
MRTSLRTPLLLAVLALGCSALPERPFSDVPLDVAAAQATAEGKLLLVDFTSAWYRKSEPTEKVVWPDEGVREWIADHAIAVQVDVDKDPELAASYHVENGPIVVLVRNGAQLDRHTDFDEPAAFVAWADGVLQGRTPTQRHADELRDFVAHAERGTPLKILIHANALVRERFFDDAAKAYVVAWDLGRQEPQHAEYTLGPLAGEMGELAEQHAPARTAFERLLRDTELRTFASDPPRSADFMQWITLCEALGKEQRVLSWYEQTRDEDGLLYGRLFDISAASERSRVENEDAVAVRLLALEFLIDQRRFDDAARLYEDPVGWACLQSFVLRVGRAVYASVAVAADESDFVQEMPRLVADERLRKVARIHAVTLAAGRVDQAEQVAHLLLDDDEKGLGRVALVKASLDLETPPPADAARWLEEAKACGADTAKVRAQLAKAAAAQAK